MNARTLGFLVLASFVAGLLVHGEEAEDSPVLKKMKAYKAAGRSVGLGFKRADKDRVVDGAAEIVKATDGLGALYPVKDDEAAAKDFQAKADDTAKAAQEFIEKAKAVKATDAKAMADLQDFFAQKVRATCLACHNAYWATFECDSKHEKWSQPKWEEKRCRVCGKPGCGTPAENEEED